MKRHRRTFSNENRIVKFYSLRNIKQLAEQSGRKQRLCLFLLPVITYFRGISLELRGSKVGIFFCWACDLRSFSPLFAIACNICEPRMEAYSSIDWPGGKRVDLDFCPQNNRLNNSKGDTGKGRNSTTESSVWKSWWGVGVAGFW